MLYLQDEYMQQIVRGEKNYEFRRYLIQPSVQRVWFYLNAPFSHVAYICEVDRARTRNEDDDPLIEDGLGNKEFNQRYPDWDNYDFACRVRSVYRLRKPVALQELKSRYGMKGAPRGLVYVPGKLLEDIVWSDQERITPFDDEVLVDDRYKSVLPVVVAGHGKEYQKRSRSEESLDTSKKQVCPVCVNSLQLLNCALSAHIQGPLMRLVLMRLTVIRNQSFHDINIIVAYAAE